MSYLINIADLRDPNDPQGRSYRQVNAERQHQIPIGALVEVVSTGVRLFVVYHSRDCDQTPLYSLCHDAGDTELERTDFYNRKWANGYPEESLKVIQPPTDE